MNKKKWRRKSYICIWDEKIIASTCRIEWNERNLMVLSFNPFIIWLDTRVFFLCVLQRTFVKGKQKNEYFCMKIEMKMFKLNLKYKINTFGKLSTIFYFINVISLFLLLFFSVYLFHAMKKMNVCLIFFFSLFSRISRVHPGSVVHLSDNPLDANKVCFWLCVYVCMYIINDLSCSSRECKKKTVLQLILSQFFSHLFLVYIHTVTNRIWMWINSVVGYESEMCWNTMAISWATSFGCVAFWR